MLHYYFTIRNSWVFWYYVLNARARALYRANTPSLNETQKRILKEVRESGIAFATLDELFPNENLLPTLQAWEEQHRESADAISKKDFLKSHWTMPLSFNFENPFCKLSIREEIFSIVNSYDMLCRSLNYIHLARTIPVGDAAPVFSQLWHRDPEEKRMMKFFLYLSDVDTESGPFTYVKNSNYGATKYGSLFPQVLPMGVYPDEKEVSIKIKKEDIITATGKAGTVIFCDTAGLHRGGYAKSKERIMFTSFYPSNWWAEKRRYTVPVEVADSITSPTARYALDLK